MLIQLSCLKRSQIVKVLPFFLYVNYLIITIGYLKPIDACQTNANSRKKTGIIGKTSTIGLKTIYASGKRDNSKVSINL